MLLQSNDCGGNKTNGNIIYLDQTTMPQCNKYNETELVGGTRSREGNAREATAGKPLNLAHRPTHCTTLHTRDLMLQPLTIREGRETHEKLLAILFLSVSIRAIKTVVVRWPIIQYTTFCPFVF